jgi:glycosyltransferase involved in cell wall biosynthesis
MTQEIQITVLIPCHSLDYLVKSLESISNQTLSKEFFEVLLIADRIDIRAAGKIIDQFKISYRIMESKTPGIVPALNLGLENITSKYVARMDEDDYMLPNRLKNQLIFLESNPLVLALGGQLQLIDKDDEVLGSAKYRKRIRLNNSDLFGNSPIAHPAAMIRLESLRSIGGYRDFLPEDWDLWVRLREIGRIENLNEMVLRYRIHPNQLSREKMYAQSLGKIYVATSYFARKSNIQDQPDASQSPSEWLMITQESLRRSSHEYVKFEKESEKLDELTKLFESKRNSERIHGALVLSRKFPWFITKYLLHRIIAKLRKF